MERVPYPSIPGQPAIGYDFDLRTLVWKASQILLAMNLIQNRAKIPTSKFESESGFGFPHHYLFDGYIDKAMGKFRWLWLLGLFWSWNLPGLLWIPLELPNKGKTWNFSAYWGFIHFYQGISMQAPEGGRDEMHWGWAIYVVQRGFTEREDL